MGCHWSRHCFSSELIGPQRRTPFACSIRQAGRWRRSRSRTPRQDSLNSWLGLGELGSDPEAVPIAIARRDGRLVDALLDAGHPVVPVKPTAIKAWRESEVPSGAKSDAGDAEVIAEYLRLKALGCVRRCPTPRRPRRLRTVSRTPHRPRRRACGGDQPARRVTRRALAWRQGSFRRHRQSDPCGVPGALPDALPQLRILVSNGSLARSPDSCTSLAAGYLALLAHRHSLRLCASQRRAGTPRRGGSGLNSQPRVDTEDVMGPPACHECGTGLAWDR